MERAKVIEYRDVHKAFDVPVLTGVDLAIAGGETLAIVGPSGGGKSVLLKTTIGLILPDAGDVLVNGESIFSAQAGALQAIRRKVGYVFQNAALFDSLTVYENVALGISEQATRGLEPKAIQDKVVHALEEVNLDPRAILEKLPAELSGGMRKRVGLARAVVGEPEILLYDEPVTGLDPVNAATVHQLIVEIARRRHVTSVVVTHDIEGVLPICDRIGLLESGRLRFVGSPKDFRSCEEPVVRAFADREAAAAVARGELSLAPEGVS
jgi:phospholipid/cholesterol/gamma-HCH transport system ATP-binding protein